MVSFPGVLLLLLVLLCPVFCHSPHRNSPSEDSLARTEPPSPSVSDGAEGAGPAPRNSHRLDPQPRDPNLEEPGADTRSTDDNSSEAAPSETALLPSELAAFILCTVFVIFLCFYFSHRLLYRQQQQSFSFDAAHSESILSFRNRRSPSEPPHRGEDGRKRKHSAAMAPYLLPGPDQPVSTVEDPIVEFDVSHERQCKLHVEAEPFGRQPSRETSVQDVLACVSVAGISALVVYFIVSFE